LYAVLRKGKFCLIIIRRCPGMNSRNGWEENWRKP